ncbi:unnamed protein product [Protopolystoma xenopodis]|uniref:Uncharacterized protein n=1 Tax=Protopolystoma xenopodis TaxID=117903 RepID=A0A3S5B5J8_9PLAT|nr:unnamed protein product [Protopolystoma xenopodis]
MRFYVNFTLFYTPRDDAKMPHPPWRGLVPPGLPYAVGRGATWYAWDLGLMVELYLDYCVPIFLPASYFPCTLFNYNRTAYLVAPISSGYGPCCVYRKNWSPVHRDFMSQFANYYDRTTTGFGPGAFQQTLDWWVIPGSDVILRKPNLREEPKKWKSEKIQEEEEKQRERIEINKHKLGKYGWFSSLDLDTISRPTVQDKVFGGYGWARKASKRQDFFRYRAPVTFWYVGNVGWAQQIFEDFHDEGPRTRELENFDLPDSCNTQIACLFEP